MHEPMLLISCTEKARMKAIYIYVISNSWVLKVGDAPLLLVAMHAFNYSLFQW